MSRILVLFASSHGHTHRIAETIATHLRRGGHEVDLADAVAGGSPPPEDYDAIVIGSRVQMGRHASEVVEYIVRNRHELARKPTALFSVSMAAASPNAGPDPQGYVDTLLHAADWRPDRWIVFAGGLPYRQYSLLLRFVMKWISRRGGHSTDTSRDHDYTDWNAVKRFADDISQQALLAGLGRDDASLTVMLPPDPQA